VKKLLLIPLAALGVLLIPAAPAAAHPLGNFSVNQYAGLTLHPDRVDVAVAVDIAEIPTYQERAAVDADHDGTVTDAERAAFATAGCREFAGAFEARAGDRLTWTVPAADYVLNPAAGGLTTSRLTCSLTAPATVRSKVTVTNRYRADRVGWRELTAVGDGVRLVDSPIPAQSVSDGLRSYPSDLLSSPVDVRSATLRVAPGTGSDAAPATLSGGTFVGHWTAAAERRFQAVAGDRNLTPLVATLAVLLALVLGAGHALLPGHGKTVLAVYLAGRRRRIRDVLAIGGTVTLSHTGGVLALGLLLSTSAAFVGERLLGYLGLASGLIVAAVGVGMLVKSLRGHRHHHHHHHDHHHHHGEGKFSLAGIGLAGGLVPSPSALVVLLGAIGLGRTGFGVLLVVAYGVGMALTLTAAGLLLITVQQRIRIPFRIPVAAPTLTAGLVTIVGLGLALRAVVAV